MEILSKDLSAKNIRESERSASKERAEGKAHGKTAAGRLGSVRQPKSSNLRLMEEAKRTY